MPDQAPRSLSAAARRAVALLFLAFVALFLVRLVLGFFIEFERHRPAGENYARRGAISFDFGSYRADIGNNVKSLKGFALAAPAAAAPGVLAALDVYTREAKIGSLTTDYDADVARALEVIGTHDSEVRIESTSGVKPNRRFSVVVRAPEGRFDDCVAALREIGDLQSFEITKQDKSEEVRQKFAERDALRAYQESLAKLRSTDGKVSELTSLEQEIQKIEQQIQSLNVSLGEFTQEESFNNINFSLTEEIPFFVDEDAYPLPARIVAALVWTVGWYSAGVAVLALLWAVGHSLRVVVRG